MNPSPAPASPEPQRSTDTLARPTSPSPESITDAVLRELEFGRALEQVARHAVSVPGAAHVLARRPSHDPAWVRAELELVDELARHLRRGGSLTPQPVPDLAGVVEQLAVPGSVLNSDQLLDVRASLSAMRLVARAVAGAAGELPKLQRLTVELPPVKLDKSLDRALDPEGGIKDGASPELERARRQVRDTRERIVSLLEAKLRRLPQADRSGDGTVTLRGERYVIPVRAEARSRVRGIVHGESSSGATVFVEPEDVVELGNDLARATAAESRAVYRVLRDLTELVRESREQLETGWRMSVELDDLYARARYLLATGASAPEVTAAGSLIIRQGVHPLLEAFGEAPVPFDLTLSGENVTLLVSGPNAGGKTVLLKAVGLITLMAQSGIVPPAGEGTRLPVFGRVFADIGDHQSIAQSLSTFSAHLAALKDVLTRVDDSSLVLLDEPGGGTDPTEGAALAGAILTRLTEAGAMTVASTHLTQLKELVAGSRGMENAFLAFDEATLRPTFRLVQGRPGRSYGLAIARRLGMPDDVLARAEEMTPEEVRTLEATLAELEEREGGLAEREAEAERLREELDRALEAARASSAELEERAAAVARRERELERRGRDEARRFLLEARKRVEEALALARAAVDEATAKEARRLVEEGVREEAEAIKELEAKGWRVRVPGRGPGKGKRETGKGQQPDVSRFPSHDSRTTTALTEIDLRGMRAHEAEAALVTAIDNAVLADLPWLTVIHGKGTGRLRSTVHEVLERDNRVADYRVAPPEQGGSGVTIVEFQK